MPQSMRIATCCYCGTRAALVLDRMRHELACSSCGAPLHEMKMMPQPAGKPEKSVRVSSVRSPAQRPVKDERPVRRKRRKGLGRKMFEELWDVVEDIFD